MRAQFIVEDLRDALLRGRYKPGSELIQTELAARYSVSRIPIRDALRELAEEGLVAIDDGGSARVISLTHQECSEVFELRILLECDCLAIAAPRLDARALEEIDRVRRKADLDANTPGWADGDWQFHQSIYLHARRPRQMRIIFSLRQTCQLLVSAYDQLPQRSSTWLADHFALVRSLRERDFAGAVAVLRRHIEGARKYLLATMQPTAETSSVPRHRSTRGSG